VLEILPALFADVIVGRLHHIFVDLALTANQDGRIWSTRFAMSRLEEAAVSYTALSYVAGPPHFHASTKL
jgi:hypothetical protein